MAMWMQGPAGPAGPAGAQFGAGAAVRQRETWTPWAGHTAGPV